jgi:hypothetical protein
MYDLCNIIIIYFIFYIKNQYFIIKYSDVEIITFYIYIEIINFSFCSHID